MAQIIKHRRGTVAELANYSGLQKGELGVTTGSLSGITTPILHLGDGSGNEYPVGRLIIGTAAPNISSYGQYNNLLFHDTDGQTLYRLHATGNDALDLTGNIANRVITGSLEISGNLSGSSTSTSSFGRVEVATINATTLSGDGSGLTGVADETAISGSWRGELSSSLTTVVGGGVSGSSTSTGSFGQGFIADKLGIGTTAPSSPLHVKSSAADLAIFESDTLNREIIIKNTASTPSGNLSSIRWLGNDDAGNSTIYAQITARVEDDTNGSEAGALAFWTNKNGSQSEKVRIDEDGFVGIGTTNPTRALDVVGDIKATGDIIAERFVVSSSVSHFTQSFSSGSTIFGDTIDDTHRFTGSLHMGTGSIDTVLHITASGNISGSSTSTGSFGSVHVADKVGIGNTTPGSFYNSKLVVGAGSAEENITIYAGNTNNSGLFFADSTSGNARFSGQIYYNHGADKMAFATGYTGASSYVLELDGNKISGSSTSTGSFGTVKIGGHQMYGDATGIGIGTADPEMFFHVHGSGGINGYVKISTSQNNKYLKLGGDTPYVESVNNDLLLNWTSTQAVNIAQNSLQVTHTNATDGPKVLSTGPLEVQSHITASGNISASGTIYADSFTSTGGDVGGISFGDDLNITGDVTASGDISGSSTSTGRFGPVHIGTKASGTQAFSVTGKTKLSLHGNVASDRLLGLEGHASQTGNAVEYFKSGGSATFKINAEGGMLATNVTSSGNISGSSTSTGSFGSVSVGGGTNTFGRVAINGANASVPNGPHIKLTTNSDAYPLFSVTAWQHDNQSIFFDSYYDGATRSSDAGSNFRIFKNDDKLRFLYDSGTAQGSANTWSDGIFLDTSGNVEVPTGNISGSSTSTGSFGTLVVNGAKINMPSTGQLRMGSLDGMVKNTIFGNSAATNIEAGGTQNSIFGEDAGAALTTGDKNVVMGVEALKTATDDSNNTAIGYRALKTLNATNARNTAIGAYAGDTLSSGTANTIIGYNSDADAADGENQIVIGNAVTGTGDNQTVIGNSSQTHVVFGGNALISGSSSSTGSFGMLLGSIDGGSF